MPAGGDVNHAVLQGFKGGSVLGVPDPAVLHESGQGRRAVGGDGGPQPLLHHPHSCLEGGHVRVGHPPRQQLPEHDGE